MFHITAIAVMPPNIKIINYCYSSSVRQFVNGKGLACRVVLELSNPFLNAGRTIVTDNFYTSLPLANELLENNTHLIGILRSNRIRLSEIFKAKLRPGEIIG